MLLKISLLSAVSYAVFYPFCFWIIREHIVRQGFVKFNLGMCAVLSGLSAIVFMFLPASIVLKISLLSWSAALLWTTAKAWPNETLSWPLWMITGITGLNAITQVVISFKGPQILPVVVSCLGGMVLSVSIFAMILGHWYLNVQGLPIRLLMRTVYVFGSLLVVRLLWDGYFLFTQTLIVSCYRIPLYAYLRHLDGIFLSIGLFFGTFLPILLLYYVRGTLLVKSTQSATGILYTVVIAVLMGDISYKYYLLKLGICL